MSTTELTYNQLQYDLQQYYSTEHYYKIIPFINAVITDGVKAFADKTNSYWLFTDLIFLDGYRIARTHDDKFTLIKVTVNDKHQVNVVFMHDIGEKPYWEATQKDLLEYIPIGEYKFHLVDTVLSLPTEY